jgi:ubiquinone/menaquinone biosynthesis C-methylase UbiE
MKWLQAIRNKTPQHKYAINAEMLGDNNEIAWSNLGLWENPSSRYIDACRALADELAHSLNLNSKDRTLDLGCGQGASLEHWINKYNVSQLYAVELQQSCVDTIQKKLPKVNIFCSSFLNLKHLSTLNHFDVVLCIDALYHSNLNSFLKSITPVLNSKARIGFHYLILSENWQTLNSFQKQKYKWLLKLADVNIENLMIEDDVFSELESFEFKKVQIKDLTENVFGGFANYIENNSLLKKRASDLDKLKIEMTAKLCRKLNDDGIIRYVQITAEK